MRKWLLPVACTALAALILYALAWQLTRKGIDHQARAKTATFESGHTPWDFTPHTVDDLIAGRAFGSASMSHDQRGLIARSRDHKSYELGVPLPYPLDLKHFPVARLGLDTEAPTQLQWRMRASLDGPLLVSSPIRVRPGDHELRQDLSALHWSRSPSGDAIPTPDVAAMLRLELRHPPDSIIRLRSLQWDASHETEAQVASHPVLWTGSADTVDTVSNIPLVLLGKTGVENMLAQRDSARQSAPAAVVIASSDALSAAPRHRDGLLQSAFALLVYALLLVLAWSLTRRVPPEAKPRRVLSLLQMSVCAGPSLAWAVGMYGDPDPGAAWLAALTAGLGFSLWLAWRGYGHSWRWLYWHERMAWRDWAMPLLTTALAGVLLFASTAEPQLPGLRKFLGYSAWAAMQQLLILAVLAPRLRAWLSPRWLCALGLAALFALAHAPNAMLMELTFLAELLWGWQFLKRPVLLPVVLAHTGAGLLLAAAVSGLPLRSLEVGARFLQ